MKPEQPSLLSGTNPPIPSPVWQIFLGIMELVYYPRRYSMIKAHEGVRIDQGEAQEKEVQGGAQRIP
jgi:hypothetical protein